MTRETYRKIAAVIAARRQKIAPIGMPSHEWDSGHEAARAYIAHDIAAALRGTNPNYNEARFLAACEVSDEP